jgi:TctA family transporter
MLLPFTFGLPPASALIMLAGIFYGAQYGSSTAAILVNVPGETSSIVTCLDGYQMARQGRAGSALAIAAIASFFAGTVATVVIALLSSPPSPSSSRRSRPSASSFSACSERSCWRTARPPKRSP